MYKYIIFEYRISVFSDKEKDAIIKGKGVSESHYLIFCHWAGKCLNFTYSSTFRITRPYFTLSFI